MPRQTKARIFGREFKIAVVKRIVAGERVRALADEFTIRRQVLYRWWSAYEREGTEGLHSAGRPRGAPASVRRAVVKAPRPLRPRRGGPPLAPEAARIAELERKTEEQARKIGEQALELDFFGRALRHFKASRPRSGEPGAPPSSR